MQLGKRESGTTSFPGPIPWLEGGAPPSSQGIGPGNKVESGMNYHVKSGFYCYTNANAAI